jgi:hypothetical protein
MTINFMLPAPNIISHDAPSPTGNKPPLPFLSPSLHSCQAKMTKAPNTNAPSLQCPTILFLRGGSFHSFLQNAPFIHMPRNECQKKKIFFNASKNRLISAALINSPSSLWPNLSDLLGVAGWSGTPPETQGRNIIFLYFLLCHDRVLFLFSILFDLP